jgi:hypothetical protein
MKPLTMQVRVPNPPLFFLPPKISDIQHPAYPTRQGNFEAFLNPPKSPFAKGGLAHT